MTHFKEYLTDSQKCLEKALQEADLYIDSIEQHKTPYWLSFSGRSGTGKTYLAKMIFKYILRHIAKDYDIGERNSIYLGNCYFTTADKLAEKWRTMMRAYIPEISEADFLVVDDIGTTADKSGFITDAMYSLLSRRLGRWTILTTNLTYKAISEQFDERLADRMIRDDNRVVKFDCDSFVKRKNKIF